MLSRSFTYTEIMKSPILCVLFAVCFWVPSQLTAQHHDHGHSRNEIGLSTGAIYALDDSAWGTGVHIHYYRTLGIHSKWSVGGMAEYTWASSSHFTLGAGIKFEPFERFGIGVLPGVTFRPNHDHEGHDHEAHNDSNTSFSMHFEVVYDLFHWDKFHLGPVFDYSWSKNDSHLMLGVHAAFCF